MRLEAERLACRRGGRMVFHDLSFCVAAGQAALLRGPNGVGKSSLLRVLAGLIPPASGEIRLDKTATADDASARQEQVAYAGHQDAVKPALGVRQNLAAWAGIFDTPTQRIDDALAFFGLDQISGRPAAQCSAGQKRRLGLARLMVVDRPVWLLDEPTVSLDAGSAGLVADLVKRHCAAGGSAIIATHIDMDLPGAALIEMTPPTANAPTLDGDAFLAGDWA